jgi:uncharacterized membrane protein
MTTMQSERTKARTTLTLVYLSTLIVFLTLDAIWLGLVGGSLYSSALGGLMLDGFRVVPAVLFYLLYISGIVMFVLPLSRHRGGRWAPAIYGACFGLCAYGTYDLTNYAVLRIWTWQLTVIDMAWGVFVTSAASLIGAWVERRRDPV